MKHLKLALLAAFVVSGTASAAPDDNNRFDGTYVGIGQPTAGSCLDSRRELVLMVNRGHASIVWQYREGRQLVGSVRPNGDLEMSSDHETFLVDLKGHIDGDTVTATTHSTSAHGDCSYEISMQRRELKSS